MYINHRVLSGDLLWMPQGGQREEFGENGIRPVHDDILLAVLRPGQEIDIEVHCIKGIGKEHAKWSPVCTASYRLLPEIVLLKEFEGEEADKLVGCFGEGVLEVVPGPAGIRVARVANARACTMSREVHRHPDLAPHVRLQRVRDHFIFSVESTGALKAAELVSEAIACMVDKAELVLDTLTRLETEVDDDDAPDDHVRLFCIHQTLQS
jgi:DNA-directed RNA polymerase I and III subunit RPAC1